ncbi:MAG: hypothetical protein HDR88_04520 [Bacteroides sp.]|nr:hypothetical protein [Bacteroides sp.]
MFRHLLIIALTLFSIAPSYGSIRRDSPIDSLMNQLDTVIANREFYISAREEKIEAFKCQLASTSDDSIRYETAGRLVELYNPFNTDSAYRYSKLREEVARKIGNPVYITTARMNQASVLNAVGMYEESVEIMRDITAGDLPDYLKPFYFHIRRTLHGHLADYSAFRQQREENRILTQAYRDSLISVNEPGSLAHIISMADRLNEAGEYAEGLSVMEEYMHSHDLSDHDKAICAWTLAESYRNLGYTEKHKEQLLISSISDMKAAVREYVSLRELALLLYQEGDLERAYQFMNIAIDDASKCNARVRIIQLNSSYQDIAAIYVKTVKEQKRNLLWALVAITVLTLFLAIALIYMRKQMKVIASSRHDLAEANTRLNNLNSELKELNSELHSLNSELKDSNARLSDANKEIVENSRLKEVYIGNYMEQCQAYIEKLDSYRKSLSKLMAAGKRDEVKEILKTTAITDEELKDFYDTFDKTFLSLFPTFVDDFNKLLIPGEEIVPKKEKTLNTELRIYALIRLGITDSDKIAKFLRYSVTTIYNYRTKTRNKAVGDRNMLDKEVMKIGVID